VGADELTCAESSYSALSPRRFRLGLPRSALVHRIAGREASSSATEEELTMGSERASTGQAGARAEDAKRQAQSAARQVRDRGLEGAESAKSAAADQAEALAGAVDRAAEELRGKNPTLADYALGLSRGISNAAQHVSNRSVEDLLVDARALAQRNPTLFVLGSVGLGVVLSRFLKASGSRMDLPDR
jgi:hypothetical protein